MKYLYTFILLLLHLGSEAQELESYNFLESLSRDEISIQIGITVNYGVDLYRIRYYTPDLNGNSHIASGLLCVPQSQNLMFPLACYQHGTILGGRNDVPSNLEGGYTLALVFASYGYVVCAPDLLGLGDSPGIHPYLHSDTEASASVDMLFAVQEMSENSELFRLNNQLFITGYSQGGHSAMALHREIEGSYVNEFSVAGSAPMSGPYSISDKMLDFTLGDREYATVAYLPWAVLSFLEAYPDLLGEYSVEDFFKDVYLDDIARFANEEITLSDLNDILTNILVGSTGTVKPKDLFLDSIDYYVKNDPDYPLFKAMKDNDTYDWAPEAPTRLFYCVGDDQVTYENAILADSVMNANGAYDTQAVQRDEFALLDHGGCVVPSAFGAILFFADIQNISTSTDDFIDDPNITINNNNQIIIMNIPSEKYQSGNSFNIYDMSGRLILSQNVDSGTSYHEIAELTPGMLIVTISHQGQMKKMKRIIKM